MKKLYRFFFRLFLAFLAVKLFLGLLGADTPLALLLTSLVIVGLSYLWDLWGKELGWLLSRLFIGLNQLPSRNSRPPTPKPSSEAPGSGEA